MARLFWKVLGAGALAGLRSITPLATLSGSLANKKSANLARSPLRLLQSRVAATGLKVLAGAEMVADKTPGMPNRTDPTAVLGRALSGAVIGAAIYQAGKGRPAAVGALVGGLAAVAATFASFHLRKSLGEQTAVPDIGWALAEDAVILGSSLVVATAPREQPRAGRAKGGRRGIPHDL